jgi:RNA polymerase sigma factor (sigma-70 family)
MKIKFNLIGETALSAAQLVDIYLDIRPRLERVIGKRLGSSSLAADLAQEIFLRIPSIKVALHSRADAERYFVRIAMNASLDHVKVEKRRSAILDASGSIFSYAPPTPEAECLARDDIRLVEAALRELPPKCRDVLLLSRIEGLGHDEIAHRLGVSRSLVEKYAVRALLHCRQRLKQSAAQS